MTTPRATYRLQLRPGFDFDDAAGLADYLASLGVSHLYASPYLQAAPGSTHGYDVVDPTSVSRELGGAAGHARLQEALGRAGLGHVLDIVPNHMAITGPENAWWWDVLRNGAASAFADFFDVDWDPPEPRMRDMVLMPILGDHYGRELEAGRIRLAHDAGVFSILYYEQSLPVAPRSLAGPLAHAAALAEREAGDDDAAHSVAEELGFLARALERLPEPSLVDEAARETRRRDLRAIDRRLVEIVAAHPEAARAIDGALDGINGDDDALDAFLSAQNHRLAYWRSAGQDLDYRRFFDIDTLAALRIEHERVFRAVHGRVLEWLRDGVLDGVRVDHPDGLRRPAEYFDRIRSAAPDAWVVAEKILMPGESLRPWAIDGTTGYDFLTDVGGLFVEPASEEAFTRLWEGVTGDDRDFHEVALEARRDAVRDVLGADLNRLANIFVQLCERRRRYRDFNRRELRQALAEVAIAFPVYRAYVDEAGAATPEDRAVVGRAVDRARRAAPELDPEILGFLERVLVGEEEADEARGLRMRFQQLTGPVAAKGEEDTAFYRYVRFVALNDVGGDPGRWGVDPAAFHDRCRRAAAEWPRTMTALSTHDTKRSEDVRARLFALSEIPEAWAAAVARWLEHNAGHWPATLPRDPAMEYLLYQTVVGAWPIGADRVGPYMEKAMREAKLRTSWTDPDEAYEAAVQSFVADVLASPFAADVERFAEPLVGAGRVVSLSQKLVQLTAPGVPDIYQGTELWELSLVDPDNRRPVDFDARRRLLEKLDDPDGGPAPETVLDGMESGLPKLWVVRQALRTRAERPAAFAGPGGYEPLPVRGDAARHGLGFLRGGEVAVVVPRLVMGLARGGGWRGTVTTLPRRRWRNVLTGETMDGGDRPMDEVLARFPVALLVADD